MISIFYAMEDEIGRRTLEEVSLREEIRLPEWQKGKHRGVVRRGVYQTQEIILAQTGISLEWREIGNIQAREVAEFVLNKFPVKVVIIAATCGGLKENLETGDFVICNPVCFEGKPPLFSDAGLQSLAVKTLKERKVRFHTGMNLTIPFFARCLEEKKGVTQKHPEAIVIEMENYFIASVAAKKGIPFLAARVVVDTLKKDATGQETHTHQEIINFLSDEFLLPFLQWF